MYDTFLVRNRKKLILLTLTMSFTFSYGLRHFLLGHVEVGHVGGVMLAVVQLHKDHITILRQCVPIHRFL